MYKSNFKHHRSQGFCFNGKPVERIVELSNGDYTRNSNGFIRNDFSVLMDAQDSLSLQRALDAMREYTAQNEDNSDKSFEEIVAAVRPRWCQSPAELDRFELYCIDNALDVYSKLKKLDDEQKEALAHAKEQERLKLIQDIRDGVKPVGVEPSNVE